MWNKKTTTVRTVMFYDFLGHMPILLINYF